MKRAFRVSAIVISLLTAVSIMTACGSGKNENSSAAGSKASAASVSSSSEVKSEISESSTVSEVSEEDKQSSVTETTQTSKEEAQESSKESSMFDISEAMEELNKYRSSASSEPVSDNDIQKELSRLLESNVQTSPAVPPADNSTAASQAETAPAAKRTLRDYIEKSGGEEVLQKYAKQYSGDEADIKFYLVDDNTLALEIVVKSLDMSSQSEEARINMTQTLEQSFETYKTIIRSQLESKQQENDLADFAVELVVKDNNGTLVFDTTI